MTGKIVGVCDCRHPHKIVYVYENGGEVMLRAREYIGSLDPRPRGDWTTRDASAAPSLAVCPAGRTFPVNARELTLALTGTADGETRTIPLWPEDPRRWSAAATRRTQA